MPIILNDMENTLKSVKTTVLPSYFSKALTGNGKKTGLLNQNLTPKKDPSEKDIKPPYECRDAHTVIPTGSTEYEFIPMDFIELPGKIHKIDKIPDTAVCVSDPNENDDMKKVWAFVVMKNAVLATETNGMPKKRTIYPKYHIVFFRKKANNGQQDYEAEIYDEYLLNIQQFANAQFKDIDQDRLKDYFDNLSVFDAAQNAAEMWDSTIPAIVRTFIRNGIADINVEYLANKLNNYPVHLEDYWEIYDEIEKNQPSALNGACNRNLNLLLNDTLKKLKQVKTKIPMFKASLPYKPDGITPSIEQTKAITTTEPCTIIQSGAGSGKSFVIQNRLRYMQQCNVDLHNTMVLSFTNAAANHIKDIAPDVNSKTIASMICDIYDLNFKHEISTIDTMINTIHAKKQLENDPIAQHMVDGLRTLKKNVNNGLVVLSEIIRSNFDEVIAILDMLGQTLFEIQSLICYYAGDRLKEPNDLCEHIIMDEVQDNSIFEFIYIIQYIIRHKASIYLVGDCSQTLYEFRASNPKAMNCLEMSGIFYCTKLETNYRSNQNILDLANITLKKIEANRYAKVQLHANAFDARPFDYDVHVEYTQLQNRTSAIKEAMPMMLGKARKWIEEKLNNDEQVCFLAYKRKDLLRFEDFVQVAFPDKTLINIIPAKTFPQSFFSKFINTLGEQFYHRPTADVTTEIQRAMIDNLYLICRDDQADIVKKYIAEWILKYREALILKELQMQAGAISPDDFKQTVFDTMIEFEIAKNGMKQRLTTLANNKLKEQDVASFNFVTSTIHSAKGLEFDNVILLYDEGAANGEEEKRMYYVGLTRAKHHEWIVAYNTTKNSNILTQFELLRDQKKKERAQAAAMASQNLAPTGRILISLPRIRPAIQLNSRNSIVCVPVKPVKITKKTIAVCRKLQPAVIKT